MVFQDIIQQVKNTFSGTLAQNAAPVGSLGVDIGSHAIKIVRLEAGKEGFKVLGFAIEKVIEKNYRDALSKGIVKAKVVPEESAVISVSGHGVVSRYIEMPMMSKTEFDSSMKFEVEKYVPFSLAEVVSDYAIIHEMKEKSKMSVLIAAAKNDIIQKKCNLAKEVNLNLKVVDLDCLALANFATEIAVGKEKGSCLGVINMGKTISNINILADGVLYLSRDISIGGDDITKKIGEALEIDYAEAEKLKNNPQAREEELLAIWEPILNNLAGEIRVSLDYFEARNNRAVDKIYRTGGASRLSGIDTFLNHVLAVDIKKLEFSDRLAFDATVNREEFKENSDLMAIACGLALR